MKTQFELNLVPRQKLKARTIKFATRALGFTLAAFTLATSTWAAEVSRSRVKGPVALAFFETVEGCIVTFVGVVAVTFKEHESPGPTKSSSEAEVEIFRFNSCDEIDLLDAFGSATLSESDFQIDKKLESAKLIKTIEVSDSVSGSSFDVSIDLTWTATGQPEKSSFRIQSRSQNGVFKFKTNDRETSREASVSGTVSVGTTNLIETADDVFANLLNVTESFIEIIKF